MFWKKPAPNGAAIAIRFYIFAHLTYLYPN
jgi:hypothetical protein